MASWQSGPNAALNAMTVRVLEESGRALGPIVTRHQQLFPTASDRVVRGGVAGAHSRNGYACVRSRMSPITIRSNVRNERIGTSHVLHGDCCIVFLQS